MPGSSAGGEHPKFLLHDGQLDVIVKFSPLLDGSAAATRWKDLLIAEYVASLTLRKGGIAVPDTRIILSAKRCYLESARFDRAGLRGRVATASFEAIDNGFIAVRRSWSASASVLRARGMITPECEEQIKLVERFGRYIANTDMHFGNLSFFWERLAGTLSLSFAPIYDMLPMLYAPEKARSLSAHLNHHKEPGTILPLSWLANSGVALQHAMMFLIYSGGLRLPIPHCWLIAKIKRRRFRR